MANTNNNEFKAIISKVENKLSFITVNEETISLLKNDEKFNHLFCDMLQTLISLENKLKIKELKSKVLIDAYKTITSKEPKGKNIKYKDAIDIEDQLSYIDVYLMNTIGHDFNVSNDVEKHEEVLDTKIVGGEEVHNFANDNNSESTHHTFNAEEFLKHNNVTVDAMAEQIVKQQAQMLLRRDIMNNKVFKYDSKPKVVIWLKMINNILFFLFLAFCLVYSILSFSFKYISEFDGKYDFISGTINPFTIIALVIFFLYAGMKIYSEIKFFKNDNFKYTIKLTHMILVSLIFIIFLLSFISLLKGFGSAESLINASFKKVDGKFVLTTETGDGIFTNKQESFNILVVERIFVIMSISTFGVLLLSSIVLSAIKPRIDLNRLQQIVNQYVKDIKEGKISSNILNDIKDSNPFGGLFF